MGYRDMGDGTWVFDHEHECVDCGLAIGCDGTYERDADREGCTRGWCPDAPERCDDCDAVLAEKEYRGGA